MNWTLDLLNPRLAEQARKQLAEMGKKRQVRLLGEPDVRTEAKAQKYNNKKVQTEEATFASMREHKRYCELKILEKMGKIRNLQLQVKFILAPSCVICGKTIPALRYYADSVYEEEVGGVWHKVVEDAKGYKNAAYRIKRHLMKTVHGIEIRET